MSLFERPNSNYTIPEDVVYAISTDQASPIQNIGTLLPSGAQILDIGCGNGILARVLKAMGKNVFADGIEPNGVAASIAKSYYRRVHQGTTDTADLDFKKYSHVVLADVIEHMVNPEAFFQGVLPKLHDNVKIYVSIPNVTFGAVRIAMLNGLFEYVDSGLLEKTHLRFFTRELAMKMFSRLGLHCSHEVHLCQDFWKTEIDLGKCRQIPIIRDTSADVYQYLFVLEKAKSSVPAEVMTKGFKNSVWYQFKMSAAKKIGRK